jgi:hypothetical protein
MRHNRQLPGFQRDVVVRSAESRLPTALLHPKTKGMSRPVARSGRKIITTKDMSVRTARLGFCSSTFEFFVVHAFLARFNP